MNTIMKTQIAIRPCTRVYLLLVVLTVVTFAVGYFDLLSGNRALFLSLLVLGFALIKGHLIGDFFMGLKGVRGPWRFVILLWLLIPGTLITIAFTLAG
jgi:cytochrome c oxidase subunit IV